MSRTQKDYQAMIKAYLSKQLSEQELAEFEVQLLEDQDLFREVQRMEAMQDHLQSHSSRLASEGNSTDSKPGWLQAWGQWITQPQSVFACLVLLVAFSLPLLQQPAGTVSESDTLEAIATSVTLQNLRNNGGEITIAANPPVLLTVDLGLAQSPETSYEVTIRDGRDDRVVMAQSNLRADNEGWLRVVLRDTLQGAHVINVRSADNQYQNSFQVEFVAGN